MHTQDSPLAATRGATTPNPDSGADAAPGSRGNGPWWVGNLPAGLYAVTDAYPKAYPIDCTVKVVSLAQLVRFLDRLGPAARDRDARLSQRDARAAAVADWLSGKRTDERRIQYGLWCNEFAARLRAKGIRASVYSVPGTDLCAVVREVPA